jgi:prophage regulatory protein
LKNHMAKNLIPYTALKAKGITYSKPHLWRLEKHHAEVLRGASSESPDTGSAAQPTIPLFPLRVPIGPGRYGYVEEEIDAYVAALIKARDAGADPGVRKPGKRRVADHEPDKPLPSGSRRRAAAPAADVPV